MKIITVSREFGSGGREVAKRLADELGFAYYDRELVREIAKRCSMNEQYVSNTIERNFMQSYPIHIGHSFSYIPASVSQDSLRVLNEQTKLLREIASEKDCVVVGRGSDVILSDMSPFKLFVYADLEARIDRCIERAKDGDDVHRKSVSKMIRTIDSDRKKLHSLISDTKWGDKRYYHLCVNTTDADIKKLVPHIADYAKAWFESKKM